MPNRYMRGSAIALVLTLGACQAGLPKTPPAAAPPPAAPAAGPERSKPSPVALAAATPVDCRIALLRLQQAQAAGTGTEELAAPFALVLAEPTFMSGAGAAAADLVADLPIPRASPAAARAAPCLIEVGRPAELAVEHRPLGRATVESEYQSGSRAARNPDYEAAELRLKQAEQAAKAGGPKVIQVGDPLLDLVGLLVGSAIAGLSRRGAPDADAALAELIATPRTVEEPVFRPYRFEQATHLGRKEAVLPVALVERATGRRWQAMLRRRETREIQVLDGLDRRDRNYAGHREAGMTQAEFDQWLAQPPATPLSDLLAGLAAAPPAPAGQAAKVEQAVAAPDPVDLADPEPATLRTAALALPAMQRADAAAPPAASVVRIASSTGEGAGVYVDERLVLTSSELAGPSALVDITSDDGIQVLGMVARRDPALGLALVQVPRAGQPAALDPTAADLAGLKGPPLVAELAGAPLFQDQRLAGLRRDPAGALIPAAAIARFLEADPAP